MNHNTLSRLALQDQFDAAHRDAKAAGPGLAGILTVAESLGRMGQTFAAMRRLEIKPKGEPR